MPLNRSLPLVTVALLAGGLLGCSSSAQVAATFDATVDFSNYHTFAFHPDYKLDDPFRQRMAEKLIADDLTQKGFRRDDAAPDMHIGLINDISMDIDRTTAPSGSVVWTTWGPYDGLNLAAGGRELREGGFIIGIRDARDKRLLWRGIAQDRVVVGNPAENEKRGRVLLEQLLAGFPPKKASK